MSGRVGVSGRVWRRVAHSDVTGYTGRRNKGENVGRFAYGDMEDGNRGNTKTWSDIVQGKGKAIDDSRGCVQVQNKRYGGHRQIPHEGPSTGLVMDKWQKMERQSHSVKMRKRSKGPFAFVRYDSKGGSVRAIENLQGAIIEGS
ncbi:hypothetical protein PIB30_017648 [Stylosanthes scabra]|uniref:RRM domain-containing protein n=1 Tax=Stylosanthes scabra TaxID=79078 RepID=A0ABU6X6K8_9FABA|nr:hypothetical protein [Stylosanthes scabra]